MLKIDGVTHWSIPVNDLEESERFYRDLLGLEYRGRLGNSHMDLLEVRDPTWKAGMATPALTDIVGGVGSRPREAA